MQLLRPIPVETDPRHALGVTFFEYAADDAIIGQLMALLSLTPVFLMVSYATIICARRDLYAAAACAGQLLGELINDVLKNIFREPRPTTFLGSGYGMPSSHAQFMAYFATFVILHLQLRDTSNIGDLTLCEYEGVIAWERQAGLVDRGLAGTGVGKSVFEKKAKRKDN
ncbi:hypothetical protein HK100_006013 [Physocladia obscura]|uniref:Dolichyldiphosphatase n=1 Tax=Physocladia obscura TaxID=109957 RepID=A0AAD5X907_9FUNG|nr:hypothetical protein HK100_006013 [Physocladia obscura]